MRKISFKRLLEVLCFIFSLSIFLKQQNMSIWQENLDSEIKAPKITMGFVSCRMGKNMSSNEETFVLIKSVLLSSILNGVSELEFHIFLEYEEDSGSFLDILKDYGFPTDRLKVEMHFHSAINIVPKAYRKRMIYHKTFRCGFTRLYFSLALKDVDSIIYMDTDFIVTGSIVELWKHFEKMNDHQLIGVAGNNQPETLRVKYKLLNCFKNKVPFMPPTGLNSGLLLMNLTKMRRYGWEDKVSNAFEDSRRASVDDQSNLNVVLYNDPGLFYKLPCQFNVRCSPCNNALLCKEAREDPYGIQCIHGASDEFGRKGRFNYIYKLYKEFDMTTQDVIKDLMIPITQSREPISKSGNKRCDTAINQFLFRNILRQD